MGQAIYRARDVFGRCDRLVPFALGNVQVQRVTMTARPRGVVAVLTRDVAGEKVTAATEKARNRACSLLVTPEPEE